MDGSRVRVVRQYVAGPEQAGIRQCIACGKTFADGEHWVKVSRDGLAVGIHTGCEAGKGGGAVSKVGQPSEDDLRHAKRLDAILLELQQEEEAVGNVETPLRAAASAHLLDAMQAVIKAIEYLRLSE